MSVELRDICKSYGAVDVIKSANIQIESGEFVVFVGPSGCGKSTLLRMIAGLETISSGELYIGGQNVSDWPASQRGIAMVFQSYALYPHLSVYENMAFGLRIAKEPKASIDSKVREASEILQLTPYLDRLPKALSGGQRQRVAIGRSIVRKPQVFLFDEPLSNLDAALRNDMRVELAGLHKRLGATMIYVTHDQVEAMTLADRIVILNGGEIEQMGPPMEVYQVPRTPFVASFIGSPKMNLTDGLLAKEKSCEIYGIRPEHLQLSEDEDAWGMEIKLIETLGSDNLLHLQSDAYGDFIMRTEGDRQFRVGDRVSIKPKSGAEHFFIDGQRVAR